MQSEQKLIESIILLAKRVEQAVDQAEYLRPNCTKMGKQVCQLSQMLRTLLCFITLNPQGLSPNLDPIHCVISEVSWIFQEALSLACKCRRKTIFCRIFIAAKSSRFHKLYHFLDVCIANMNCLILIYNPDFVTAFSEIFHSLPHILTNDSSIPLALSFMLTENKIWEPINSGYFINYGRMIKEIETLLLCLAKFVAEEHVELQFCCLMTTMEITSAAESNLELRCKAFKTNSPGAKAIREQLLRVIKDSEDPTLQVLAIKSVGSLARIFYERANDHVIGVLVSQLGNENQEVVIEAVVALKKFACKDNYLHKAHSKRMIEFNAAECLVKLLRDGERMQAQQLQVLELICYIAMNADYSEAIEQARVVTAIRQLLDRKRGRLIRVVSVHPVLKQLIPEALDCLTLYYRD